MKHAAVLVDLFTAAFVAEADVVIYERRTAGARGALHAWAAVANHEVKIMKVGRGTAHQVEFAGGGGITVHVREHDVAAIGAQS